MESNGAPGWLIALASLCFFGPVVWGLYTALKEEIADAREHDEPVSSVFANIGNGCVGLLVKVVIIGIAVVIVVTVGSFVIDMLSGPSYDREYEAWRP